MKSSADLPDVCLCGALRRAARKATRLYDELLTESGLKVTQFSLLRNIGRTGHITVSDLARRLDLERTAMGRNLDLLEKKGFIRSSEEAKDARMRVVALTKEGRKTLALAVPVWKRAQAEMRRRLDAEKPGLIEALVSFAGTKRR